MALEKIKVEKALTSKLGCKIDKSHHNHFHLYYEGKIIRTFRTSHSKGKYKTIDDSGIGRMLRGLDGVPVRFFKDFVKCTNSKEALIGRILDSIPAL